MTATRFPDGPLWIDDDPARSVAGTLAGAGIAAFATGACVREAVLGRSPRSPGTVEILVGASPDRLAAALRALPATPGPGPGLSLGDTRFSFRPLGAGDPDGLASDALRTRDFTANAVLLGLDGSVRDPLGGLRDIRAGRVRLAHPAALRDDPVRVIRMARMRILLGEAEPDPEALSEAGFYAPEVARCSPARTLSELVRLLRCGPSASVSEAFAWLDGIGALDGLALVPDVGRLSRFLAGCERAGVTPDPALSLGVLCALRVGRRGWIDGLRTRFGDDRDAAFADAAAILGAPPSPGEPPSHAEARAAAAVG